MAGIDRPDAYWMRKALRLAERGLGLTRPNPPVGCVLVKDGRLVGEGWHKGAGQPHAEIEALRSCTADDARGADCYVTLEPCNHVGRTPPCTEALIDAGVSRVIIGVRDPNPSVRGGGIERLREAGIAVETGVLEAEVRRVTEAWLHWITTGLPFVTLKMAVSLDGKIATADRESRWISGETSRRHAHRMRRRTAAIMVGRGTVADDDPSLTARRGDRIVAAPVRVVADTALSGPPDARIYSGTLPGRTIIACGEDADPGRAAMFEGKPGVGIVRCPRAKTGGIELKPLLEYLGAEALESLIVEGGPTLAGSFLAQQLVHKVTAYIAPVIIGGVDAPSAVGDPGFRRLDRAPRLRDTRIRRLDPDVLVEGYPVYGGDLPDESVPGKGD